MIPRPLDFRIPRLKTKPTRDQATIAYQFIRNGILMGRFLPGERLTEAMIASDSGVSRTPVREALRWLERDGVVSIEKNKGASVNRLTAQRVSDIYEFRARLEGFAANLAAERGTVSDHESIISACKAFAEATASDSADRVMLIGETNRQVHLDIASASKNAFLASALSATTNNPLVLRTHDKLDATELHRSVVFHELIAEAIVARQGARAERLMIEHVLQARDSVIIEFD